jgi:hypothetical protein
MSPDDLAYYRERAFFERLRASESTVRPAADIHLQLACFYEKLVELEENHVPVLRVVRIGHPHDGVAELPPSPQSPTLS